MYTVKYEGLLYKIMNGAGVDASMCFYKVIHTHNRDLKNSYISTSMQYQFPPTCIGNI